MQQENGEGPTPAKRPLLSSNASNDGSAEQANRDARLVRMFCDGLFSYNILNDKSWQTFFKYEFPNYQMPCVKTFLEQLVPNEYDKEKNKLKQMLESVKYLAVTINNWKIGVKERRRGRNMYTVTIHFIYGGKRINQCFFAKIAKIRNDDIVLSLIKDELMRWNVFNKIVLCVASRAISVKLQSWGKELHTCLASTVAITIHDVMKSLLDELDKRAPNQKKTDPFSWHSQYIWLQNFADNADSNSSDDKKIYKDCINLLKPFEDLTKTLSSEQYQSLSYVIPILVGLKTRLNECTPTTDTGIVFKKNFLNKVSNLLEDTTSAKHKATFMDPRFKEACFINQTQAESVRGKVIEEIEENIKPSVNHHVISPDTPSTSAASDHQNAVPVPTIKQEDTDNGLLDYLDDKLRATFSANSLNTRFKVEQYLDLPHVNRGENPCQFWEQLKDISKYSELYDMSQKYLCMPATAQPVETVSGDYIWNKHIKVDDYNDRKNEMGTEKINEILFLHSFYARTSDDETE